MSGEVLDVQGVRASAIETKDVRYLGERTAYRSIPTVFEIRKAVLNMKTVFLHRVRTNDHANEVLSRDHVEESPYTHAAHD